MANKIVSDRVFKIGTGTGGITTATTLILGDGSDGIVSTIAVHIVDTSSFSGSITVKARSRLPQADTNSVPFVAVSYLSQYLNGSTGANTYASTALTTTSVILIPASGLTVALDLTTYTSGTATVYWSPLEGAAA